MLRVTINGKSAKTSLGIRVPSKDWDVKRSRCRMREHTESKRINIFLENARSKCNRAYTSLQDESEREGIEPSEILYFTVVMSF